MKNMKTLFTVLFVAVSLTASAQKVKIKKGIVLIDDVETYKHEKEGSMESFFTLGGKEFLTIIGNTYQEKNPAHFNRNNPQAYRYPEFITKWVYTVKFPESGKELFTDLGVKDVIKAVYKAGLVDTEGELDEEKLSTFINKYNNENLKYKLDN